MSNAALSIDRATPEDIPLLLELIGDLAEYEKLRHEAVATAAGLHAALFGPERVAYAVIARMDGDAAGFALYFYNFSTFLGRPGLYLEDLFVRPNWRRHGIGRALLVELARIAVARGCGRMEWAVLDWNEMARRVYRAAGAVPLEEWTIFRLTGAPLTALAGEPRAIR